MAKILLVEDDPFISEIYQKKFAAEGFEVIVAATGPEVLKLAGEQPFDAILLDLVLPEMSGLEVLKALRQKGARNARTKIIVFSNLSGEEDQAEAVAAGADGFISKTEFTPSQVVEEVKRALGAPIPASTVTKAPIPPDSLEPPAETAPTVKQSNSKRILFLEDEGVFIDMFGKRLRDEGYEVRVEREGVKGLEAALAGHYDLLITDIQMPGLDGREVISQVRAVKNEKALPIILLSASLLQEELAKLERSGAVSKAFLKTQITPTELV